MKIYVICVPIFKSGPTVLFICLMYKKKYHFCAAYGKRKKTASKTSKKPKEVTISAKTEKPVILITNDDGVTAPGIMNLVEAVKDLGKIVVVAPDKPQSGMGHAITIGQPLRLHKVHVFGDIEAYSCTGTPVDCVKLAVDKVLHRKPDLCLSGINHGANHSINVIYSGTMSAAVEAAIESIPSAGFSLLDYSIEADFTGARKYVRMVVEKMLATKLDKHTVLNVNIPSVAGGIAKRNSRFAARLMPNMKKIL